MRIVIRELSTHEEYHACLALQHETWGGGQSFRDAVGPVMLLVPQKIGGITAGAFDPAGRLLGFVYGLTGLRDGRPVHWSHMLAVSDDAQDHDIGRRLKEYQRGRLLEQNIEVMYWTYDPLVARNAHVNFMKLGVDVSEYVEDIYGSTDESTVDPVIGTDRFIVAWNLRTPRSRTRQDPPPPIDSAPLVNATVTRGEIHPVDQPRLVDDDVVHIAVPPDIQALKTDDPSGAVDWRNATRHAITTYLARGYDVHDFIGSRTSPTHFYRLRLRLDQPDL